MATTGDYISLFIVLSIIGAVAAAVLKASPAAQTSLQQQKDAMKKRGLNLSSEGLSVKTDRRALSREEYVDATQRSFAKSGEVIGKHLDALSWGDPNNAKAAEANIKSRKGRSK